MSLLNRALAKLLSLLIPWQEPLHAPPSRQVKRPRTRTPNSDESLDNHTQNAIGKRRPTLETINADVLRLITLELKGGFALSELSLCSRTLRALVAPVLFSRCRVNMVKDPPLIVRSFARQLTIESSQEYNITPVFFKRLLEDLRSLTGITFNTSRHIPLAILELCLKCPRIRSLSFGPWTDFTSIESYAAQISTISNQLTAFSCKRKFWPEVSNIPRHSRLRHEEPRDLKTVLSGEAAFLSALLPRMCDTVSRLALPMQTSPILAMAELSWPKLRHLTIDGRYLSQAQADSLPTLLSSLTQLATLSIQIRRDKAIGRAPILGIRDPPSTILSGLRSLTIAYPDPDDDIFLIDTSILTHLSLRDCPRYYHEFGRTGRMVTHWWATPLLSAAETMHILQRMDMPRLSRLELVYLADTAGADDELLQYVASTFTELAELEIHRYRVDRKEEVDYAHIARLLTPMKGLRSVRLNLDFHDDHGPYCGDHDERDAWFEIFKNHRGPEIVDILQECPYLEYVALLYHGHLSATWTEFHPLRCTEPRFVLEYDAIHNDEALIPVSWYTPKFIRRRRAPVHEVESGSSSE